MPHAVRGVVPPDCATAAAGNASSNPPTMLHLDMLDMGRLPCTSAPWLGHMPNQVDQGTVS